MAIDTVNCIAICIAASTTVCVTVSQAISTATSIATSTARSISKSIAIFVPKSGPIFLPPQAPLPATPPPVPFPNACFWGATGFVKLDCTTPHDFRLPRGLKKRKQEK